MGTVGPGDTVTYNKPEIYVSKVGTTRIKIDSELANFGEYRLFSFYSMRHSANKPAELHVTYRSALDFYGAALGGPRWAAEFDSILVPDLGSSASYEAVDETLTVYLVWQNSDATGMQKLSPPIPLDQASWWGTPGFTAADFTIKVTHDPPLDVEYHACPEGEGLDEVTLNADGTLIVRDLNFGGIGSKTRIELRSGPNPDPQKSVVRVIALQWDNPGTYYDAELAQNVDAAPDGSHAGIVTVEENIESPEEPGFSLPVRLPTRIVEWVSTDISGVVPIRIVEEEDLAALSAEMGNPVCWGFDGDTCTRNYEVNCTPFGGSATQIDASDLAAMAADIDNDDCTGTSKVTTTTDKDAILAWFGIEATGAMVPVGPNGELVPGYEIVDWEQNRRAI